MATNIDKVQQLYVAYFNRPADVAGLNYWVGVVAKGVSTDVIAAGFAQSAEYKAMFAGKGAEAIIDTVYMNMFGRHAEKAALDFYGPLVQNGTITIDKVVTDIVKGAQGTDAVAYDNKVTAAVAFTEELDMAGNEADRLAYASGDADVLQVAKTWLATVTTDASLATALASVGTVADSLTGIEQQGETVVLTKGLDTLNGTAGNDTFLGAVSGTAELNTLNALDTLNGGAGTDTLKIVSDQAAIAVANLNSVEVVEVSSAVGATVNTTTTTGVTNLNIVKAGGAVAATAGATTNVDVSLKDGGTVTVNGGKDVNVALTDNTNNVDVGATGTDPAGAVTITTTGAAAINNTNVAMGDISVGGGKTVTVAQHATSDATAIVADGTTETVTQGDVVVTASATTTDVTVTQDADVAAASRAAVAGATEVASVKFTALTTGNSVTVGGLVFTAAKDLTAAQVATAFSNLSSSALKPGAATSDTQGSGVFTTGTYTNSLLANWSSAAASGDTVVFTAKANTAMVDLTATGATVTTTTQGVTAVSAKNTMGVTTGTVTIAGGAVLKNVTVDGYAASTAGAGVTGATNTALDTIKLSNGTDFDIASAAATLNLTATDVDGTVTITAGTKTLNATVNGDDTATTLVSGTVETLKVSGTGNVVASTAALTAATSISTTGMTAGTSTVTIADGTVTSFAGGAGADSVTVSNAGTAITKSIDLGAGNDTLTLSGTVVVPTAALAGGAGTDTIAMTGASAVSLSANGDFAGKIDGFEKLSITDVVATASTVNMANMDGINYVIAKSSTGSAAAATKSVFTIDFTGTTKLTGSEDTLAFDGATLAPVADITTASALVLALGGLSYTNWNVKSVAGNTITFEAKVAGVQAIPTTAAFVLTDGDADSVVVDAITSSTAGTAVGATAPSLTIDKLAANSTVELAAVSGDGVIVKLADASGSADVLNLVTKVAAADVAFGTVDVAGVETIKLTATDTDTTAAINTGSFTLKAAAATTLTVAGNSNVTLTLDATTNKLATIDAGALTGKLNVTANGGVVMTITGGSGNDTLTASTGTSAKADVINGGAGSDIIVAGTNGSILTGGAGNDLFVQTAASAILGTKEGNTYSTITDFSAGDLLQLQARNAADAATAAVGTFAKLTATLNETTATFSNFLDAAIVQATAGNAVYFNYKGDAYVVIDSGAESATVFNNGQDEVIKLTGINGDNLSFNSTYGTVGLI